MKTYQTVSVSDIVFYNSHLWIVPKPDKKPNFKVLMTIFQLDTWILIFIIFLLIILIWYKIAQLDNDKTFSNINRCVFDIYMLSFSLGLTIVPKSFKLNTIMLIYILYTFHLNYFYQGKLSGVLTSPSYDSRILNLQQLADSKLKVLVIYHNLETIKKANSSLAEKIALKTFVFSEKDKIINRPQYVMKNRTVALATLSGDLNLTDSYKKEIDLIQDAFLPNLEATYQMKKRNPILFTLNNVIRATRECGLHQKWLSSMRNSNFINIRSNDQSTNKKVVLKFEHLQGPFYILILGLLLSLLIFIIEIFFKNPFLFLKVLYVNNL